MQGGRPALKKKLKINPVVVIRGIKARHLVRKSQLTAAMDKVEVVVVPLTTDGMTRTTTTSLPRENYFMADTESRDASARDPLDKLFVLKTHESTRTLPSKLSNLKSPS